MAWRNSSSRDFISWEESGVEANLPNIDMQVINSTDFHFPCMALLRLEIYHDNGLW